MDKNRIKVSINGVEYVLKTTENDEYVQRVAVAVDRNMREISKSNSMLSSTMVGVLTSINFADRALKAEDELTQLRVIAKNSVDELELYKEKYEENELKLELLKEEVQKLKIELAKKDTELKNYTEE